MNPQLHVTKTSSDPTIHQLNSGNLSTPVSNQSSDTRKTYELEVKNTAESLFKREVEDLTKLISRILVNCNLKSILLLRLVSKGFYHLASSSFSLGIPSPLVNKAIIAFQFEELYTKFYPPMYPSMPEKLNFAQNNTLKYRLQIGIYIPGEFYEMGQLILPFTPSNTKNIEVLDFNEFSFHQAPITAFFMQMEMDYHDLNSIIFENLNTIVLGDVTENSQLALSKSFNQNTTLRIGDIRENKSLCLIGGPKLSTLSIGNIEKNASLYLILALSFKDLKICTIKEIGDNVTLEFPDALDQLTSFTVGKIGKNSRLKLPKSLNNLISFTLGKISYDAQIQLPISVKNLKGFNIEESNNQGCLIYWENKVESSSGGNCILM